MKIPLFAHVAAGFYFFPAAAGMIRWKRLNMHLKLFALFCVYSIIHIIAEFILGRLGIANQFLSNIYRLLQIECIFFLYHHWLQDTVVKNGIKISALLYFIFWIFDTIAHPFPNEFREPIAVVANILMLVSSLIVIENLFRTTQDSIFAHSVFWISSGLILYTAGTIVVLTMSNTILKMGIEYFNVLWHINWGFTIIANVFFTRSFLCKIY